MPAITVKKGVDVIPIEQREGEDVAAKIAALIEQHGADNVLLDGKPAADYHAEVAAAESAKLLADETYRAGFEAGRAAERAEAAASSQAAEPGKGADPAASLDFTPSTTEKDA